MMLGEGGMLFVFVVGDPEQSGHPLLSPQDPLADNNYSALSRQSPLTVDSKKISNMLRAMLHTLQMAYCVCIPR
jgi:hypothetical protein